MAKAKQQTKKKRPRGLEAAIEQLAEAQRGAGEQIGRLDGRLDRVELVLERLAEAQQRTEERLGRLAEAQARTEERLGGVEAVLARLAEAQQQTERELRELIRWQVGEDGRRRGERYERDVVRSAPVIFNGGQGGCADERWVRERPGRGAEIYSGRHARG